MIGLKNFRNGHSFMMDYINTKGKEKFLLMVYGIEIPHR